MGNYGHIIYVSLSLTNYFDMIPKAFAAVTSTILQAAIKPGERIDYDTLTVRAEMDVPNQRIMVIGSVNTVPRPYTKAEMNDIQVDMIRALNGVDRNE